MTATSRTASLAAAGGFSAIEPEECAAQSSAASEVRGRPADFDRVARVYRWLEYMTFGPMLSRCRLHFLSQLSGAKKVLVLGDGDGRFVEAFLRVNPHATLDIVDSSAAMLRLLHRRIAKIAGAEERVTLVCCDAREIFAVRSVAVQESFIGECLRPGVGRYDLVVLHFFLDCFTTAEVEALVCRVAPCLSEDARWLVSEFAVPTGSRLARAAGGLTIGALYRFFGLVTGLRVRRLPDYAGAFAKRGFGLSEGRLRFRGLLISELWRRDSFGAQPKGGCAGNLD